jgi:hypothetical protein
VIRNSLVGKPVKRARSSILLELRIPLPRFEIGKPGAKIRKLCSG